MWNVNINICYLNRETVNRERYFVPRICRNCVYPWLSGTWSYPPVSSKRCRRRRQEVRRRAALLRTSRIPYVVSFRDASSPCIQIPLTVNGMSWSRARRLSSTVGACSATRGDHAERTKNGTKRDSWLLHTDEEGVATITFLPLHSCCSFVFNRQLVPPRTILITGAGWGLGLVGVIAVYSWRNTLSVSSSRLFSPDSPVLRPASDHDIRGIFAILSRLWSLRSCHLS